MCLCKLGSNLTDLGFEGHGVGSGDGGDTLASLEEDEGGHGSDSHLGTDLLLIKG